VPLLLEVLLSLLDFLFLLRHPLLELRPLGFIGPWRVLPLLVHLIDVLLFSLLPIADGLLSHLDHLGVLIDIKVARGVVALELLEWVPLEKTATGAA